MKVVVGGDGWVSRTAIAHYVEKRVEGIEDICVYGSTTRISKPIFGSAHIIEAWIPKSENFRVETFIPAAFLTLDRYSVLGETNFRNRNLDLISRACKYIELNAPEKCILFSSGVVSLPDNQFIPRTPKAIYRELKKEEENRVIEACLRSQTKLIICRMFNVSGRYVTSPNSYALSNFLYQGIMHGRIIVESEGAVWRRYSDLGQIIEVCNRLSINQEYLCFESGGVVVELHDLARQIANALEIRHPEPSQIGNSIDSYFSKTNTFETLADSMEIKLYGLRDQIIETWEGVEEHIQNSA